MAQRVAGSLPSGVMMDAMAPRALPRRPAGGCAARAIASNARSAVVATSYSRTSWRTAILSEQEQQQPQPGEPDLKYNVAPSLERFQSAASSSSDCASSHGDDTPAADPDASAPWGGTLSAAELRVKLSLAGSSGRLDLTDCRLERLPPGVLELTELEELQLSGNCLTHLPDSLSRLTALRRLGLAGNRLTALPPGLGCLTALEGLWLHGNQLAELPAELGGLGALRALSLAGNCLESLPSGCLSGLTSLTDLTLAGNRLTTLPPGELAHLTRLRKLALNGNRLGAGVEEGESQGEGEESHTPLRLGLGAHMTALCELMLQGNCLREVDPEVFECPALTELSLADNRLTRLPARLAGASCLARLHLFGNRLTALPAPQLAALPALASLWLEGNPLGGAAVAELLRVAGAGGMPRLRALGLDQSQMAAAAAAAGGAGGALSVPASVRVGCVLGSGPGYFKLQYGPQRPVPAGGKGRAEPREAGAGGAAPDCVSSNNELLVVAFGSAPGTPNWGGLLGKVHRAAAAESERYFDVLYVADPSRDWYGGGDDSVYAYYRSRLAAYTARYRRVLLLGDSMGATAALMFADLATAALAFCPQVDLSLASIRPGRPAAWLERLRARLRGSVLASRGRLQVLVGTWQHDLQQANMLPQRGQQAGEQASSAGPRSGHGYNTDGGSGGKGPARVGWRDTVEADAVSQTGTSQGGFRPVGAATHRSPWSWQQREGQSGGSPADREGHLGAEPPLASGGVDVRVFSVDSHRLAAALDARGQLVALVREAVLHELGMRSGNVRVSNML